MQHVPGKHVFRSGSRAHGENHHVFVSVLHLYVSNVAERGLCVKFLGLIVKSENNGRSVALVDFKDWLRPDNVGRVDLALPDKGPRRVHNRGRDCPEGVCPRRKHGILIVDVVAAAERAGGLQGILENDSDGLGCLVAGNLDPAVDHHRVVHDVERRGVRGDDSAEARFRRERHVIAVPLGDPVRRPGVARRPPDLPGVLHLVSVSVKKLPPRPVQRGPAVNHGQGHGAGEGVKPAPAHGSGDGQRTDAAHAEHGERPLHHVVPGVAAPPLRDLDFALVTGRVVAGSKF